MTVSKIFIDDNYSGYVTTKNDDTLFDRPGFKEMMKGIKNGSITTVLVKDLSRLGRRSSVVMLTLERIKAYGCQCLEIQSGEEVLNDTTGIFAWSHEHFLRETSRKVRASLNNMQKDGRVIMGNHYGYIKFEKTNLIVDEDIRPCIELIFSLYLDGNGYTKIANYLNSNTLYPTPSSYYEVKHSERGRKYNVTVSPKWEPYHIARIIKNDIYCGTLRTHTKVVMGIKGQIKAVPQEKQYVFPNHHDAIISQADFDLVQGIRKRRDKENYKGSKFNYLFSGMCICSECNSHVCGYMLKRKESKPAYNCSEYIRFGTKGCSNKMISEQDLLIAFRKFLFDFRPMYSTYLESVTYTKEHKNMNRLLENAQREKRQAEKMYQKIIRDQLSIEISDLDKYNDIVNEQYGQIEKELLETMLRCNRTIEHLKSLKRGDLNNRLNTYLSIMDEVLAGMKPSRKLIESLIERIYFNKDRTIVFKLRVEIKSSMI